MTSELTKALLLEEVVEPAALADALYVSVTAGVPLVQALADTGAVRPELLVRYLGRAEAPSLQHVVPVMEVVDRLPAGLCERLLAVPVRRDAITGTVDVVVADASDTHAVDETAFHLQVPVRMVRAPLSAIQDAIRKLGARSQAKADDELLYDSRPRSLPASRPSAPPRTDPHGFTGPELPIAPMPPPRVPHTVPSVVPSVGQRRPTPPWGTPVHTASHAQPSEPPKTASGSEIPIPLTRRTVTGVAGGTQRPPPVLDPRDARLGEGYPVDPLAIRAAIELRSDGASQSTPSFIPDPPPAAFAARAPNLPLADLSAVFAALKVTTTSNEVLELLLSGGRALAVRIALFLVKRAGYLGWTCTPEFGDRSALQAVLIPHESSGVFERAVDEGLYLGPIRLDPVHAPLLHVMGDASRDVAVVPVKVAGKTAALVVAHELLDTMLSTQRLEELAIAAGEALARIVRTKR